MLKRRSFGLTLAAVAVSAALVTVGSLAAQANTRNDLCESPSSSYGVQLKNSTNSGSTKELPGHQCGTVSVRIEVFNGTTFVYSNWNSGAQLAARVTSAGCVSRSDHGTSSPHQLWTLPATPHSCE
jgi:hypothetical protein